MNGAGLVTGPGGDGTGGVGGPLEGLGESGTRPELADSVPGGGRPFPVEGGGGRGLEGMGV